MKSSQNPTAGLSFVFVSLLLLAPLVGAQTSAISIDRVNYSSQTGASTVTPQVEPFTLNFHIRGGTTDMSNWGPAFYIPGSGGTPQSGSSNATNTGTLNFSAAPNNGGSYMFTHDFATNEALEAFYPIAPTDGGVFGVKFLGSAPPTPALFDDGLVFAAGTTYPSVTPQISSVNNGAVWSGSTLRINPTGITTVTFNTFPEYSSTTYGSFIAVGIYSNTNGVVDEASTESYYLPLGDSSAPPVVPVNQPAITQLSIDGSWLTPGGTYTMELQYAILSGQPEEATLNGIEFQGLATYRKLTTISIQVAPSNDFNADGSEDIVLENGVSGERVIWLMNGAEIASSVALPTFTAGWHFAGTGDFSADGKADIVLQNTQTGERVVWLMDGATIAASANLPTLPVAWQFACVGDLNADGKPDIILQNTLTNDRIIWLMDGTSITSSVALPSLPASWQICGAMDFNGDGQADVLIQNTMTGERVIWVLNGELGITQSIALPQFNDGWRFAGVGRFTPDGLPNILLQNSLTGERVLWSVDTSGTITASTALPTLPTEWNFAGAAINQAAAPALNDLNLDGQSDILVTDTETGTRIIWLMNGNTIATSVALPTLPSAWVFSGIGDFNGDGMNDILLQNTSTGDRIVWVMNGTAIGGSIALPTLPVSWSFAAVADVNRDGQSDIVLQNSTTGERVIWVMDRTRIHGSLGLPTLPTSWQIAAGGGFSADARTNLVLENTSTGDRLFWALNADGQIHESVGLPTFLDGWRFAGTGDFNADAEPDIILQNFSTGERVIWQMSHTAIEASLGLPTLPPTWTLRD